MSATEGFLQNWFKRSIELQTDEAFFQLLSNDAKVSVSYNDLFFIEIEQGLVYDSFTLHCRNELIRIQGLSHKRSKTFRERIVKHAQKWLLEQFMQTNFDGDHLQAQIQSILDSPIYLSQSHIRNHIAQWSQIGELLAHPYFDYRLLPHSLQDSLSKLEQLQQADSELLKQRNREFIDRELKNCRPWLANLEDYPLTDEQLTAVITDEDCNLLIASAGSGKSSTLVAKVVYLLRKELVRPHEIALLAYNDEASQSIRLRLTKVLGETVSQQIQISTFHALGLEIIQQQNGFKPRVIDLAQGGNRNLMEFFVQAIETLSVDDSEFHQQWLEYLALYKKPRPPLFTIESQLQYYDYLLQIGARYQSNRQGKRRPVFTTLNGIQVSSLESLMIANWLLLQGVSFQYLKPIELEDGKKALPADFYYPEIDLYHDHFALNSEGNRPKFLENYDNYLAQKQNLAKTYEFDHLVTTSADFENGEIFNRIKTILIEKGLELAPLSLDKQCELLRESFQPFIDLSVFCSFLQHFKANGANLAALDDKIELLQKREEIADGFELDKLRTDAFVKVFKQLYRLYEKHLHDHQGIDFNDQINQACDVLENRQWLHPFKYLLVDEFQDISQDRKRLLKAILKQNPLCKLLAVGDDWQSIYRFSGADIDIMTHFERHFGVTAVNYLTRTFRCYQGIADIAANFVQANPEQLKKSVKAHADIDADQVIIEAYSSQTEHNQKLLSILDKLNRLGQKRQMQIQVFLLARYHRLKPENLPFLQQRFASLNLEFKSIHASKGLEADYVVLLNMESGTYGFPSTLSDDPLLHLVIPQFEHFEHAEERRLFYVALTRAKRGVFILSNSVDTSAFVNELVSMPGVKSSESLQKLDLCPKCQSGKMQERHGQYSIFWGCSNFPACDHREKCFCPKCGVGTLVARESEHGKFYGCSTYPECDYIHSREQGGQKLKYSEATGQMNTSSAFKRVK